MFEFIVIWQALGLLAGHIGAKKGRNAFGFYILSLVLSPIIAVPAAILISAK